MLSHHPPMFCGYSHCSSGDKMFLVVTEQYSACSRSNPPLLFMSKANGKLWSLTQNFTRKRRLKIAFASVPNKKKKILATCFLNNDWRILDKKFFPVSSKAAQGKDHPAKFGGHTHCSCGDIMVLVFYAISQDDMIKGLCDFIGRSPSR